jgi:hypothetical protein
MARLPVRSLIKGVYKNSDGSADSVNSLHDVIELGQVVLYALFQAIAVAPSPAPECKIAFHTAWITQGLWIRDEFSIDPLIPAALANLLPGYSGPPLELFRGERWSNHEAGTYGPSWSSKQSVARCFASGLNRCPETGGVP